MAHKTNTVPLFDLRLSPQDKAAVAAVLDSGWITSGPICTELEQLTCKQTGARYAVALSSATSGLQLGLRALGVGPGDEVIAPSFTFAATVAAILHVGARPVLADIDENTLCISPESILNRVTNNTRAVLSVDFAGMPCDYSAIRSICRTHRLKFISDAAHSQGASFNNKPVGKQADVTVFSLYSTKNVTAGEGGIALTQNKSDAERIRRLSLHGITSPTHLRNREGNWRYDVSEVGYKANLSDINAALALSRARRLESLLKKRRDNAAALTRALAQFSDFLALPGDPPDRERAWHLFVVRLVPRRWKISRDTFIAEMKKLGVGCGVHYIPVHHFSAFKSEFGRSARTLPVTEKIAGEVVSLPLYPELTREQIKKIVDSVGLLVKRHGR